MDDDNAVAIIGIACRFPGADDTDEYLKNLEEGKCFIDEVPKRRWDSNKADVRDIDKSWKDCSKYAALIDEHDKWDNKFFGISDSEAAWMNPQHCLALEVTHSAIENAGITLDQIKGTKTGVFIGAMNDDVLLGLPSSRHELNNFVVTGMAPSMTSNRISYHFDLRGPSITLDTACSSALVAVHLGCQSIRAGEIETAVCGGVNIILTPLNFIPLSKAKMISPTGKSCAFSKDADGYVRGEGCGIVILKNYKKAVEDGDRIWSLVATGCNQDGHSNTPITAPSSKQQHALLQDIYTKFRVDPASIQYIETHGTSTPVGDPIEVKALATFFAPYLKDEKLIPIGSVKTNIGHLESSAGTAGLIKTILMMKSGNFVPYLDFKPENANPKIDFENIPFRVIKALEKWLSSDDGSRSACINSFGFGGTNCHAIIRQLNTRQTACQANPSGYVLICFSAKSLPALIKTIEHTKGRISVLNYHVKDMSFTSLLKRSHFKYRFSCAVSNVYELQSEISTQIKTIEKKSGNIKDYPFLIFVFCGVGTVWLGMCQQMLDSYNPFHEKFLQIDKMLTTYTGFSIINEVRKPSENLATDPYKGPLLIFACQVSLFHLWSALGVKVNCIIGQSVGEVAAAHASGCLNLQDAVKVIFYRSLLSAKASGGSMMVIGKCNVEEIQRLCDESDKRVCIAVYSSKEACVVSGDTDAICNMKEKLDREKPYLLKKKLDVGCAYHSYHMDSISKEIESKLFDISGKKPHTVTISTVSGKEDEDGRMGTPTYWTQNLRQPVLLREAISSSLRENAHNIIVEIGPRPVVKAHLTNITDLSATCVPSMNQPNEQKSFVSALGILHENRVNIDWKVLFNGNENIVDFPRYKFNRDGNLLGALSLQAGLRAEFINTGIHPFVSKSPMSEEFHVEITPIVAPYVYEHRVHNRNIAPGAVYGEIGLTVATQVLDLTVFQVDISLHFIRPLAVGKDQSIELQTHIKDQNNFEVKRKEDVICKGKMCKAGRQPLKYISISDFKKRCQTPLETSVFYKKLKALGFEYGESLRVIGDCFSSDDEFVAEMIFPSSVSDSLNRHCLHPSILDGALQTVVLCYENKNEVETQDRPIPVKISSLRVHRPMEPNIFVIGKKTQSNSLGSLLDLFIVNIYGDIVVEVKGYEVMNMNREKQQFNISDKLYHITWTPVNIDQNISGENGKTLSITFSSEAKRSLENVFRHENDFAVALPFDYDRVSVQELLEVLFKYIESQFVRIGEISQICYFPGLVCRSTDQNANEVFVAVKISCVVLTHLIQYLVKKQVSDVPIYILTKQTQQKTESIDNNTWVNVIGSELWGMVRCILRERILSNIRLIDLENETDLLLVRKIMFNLDRDQWRKTSEYKIEDQRLYINQIRRLSADEPSHRKITFNKNEILELRYIHNESFEDLIFVPKTDKLSNKAICSSYVKLKVTSVFCSDTWTPKIITHAIGDLDPWTHCSKDGHEVILSEISGFLESNIFDSSSTSCFSRTKVKPISISKQEECISCFPCIASNTVFMPENCVIEKRLFPMYRPGMLLEIVMYFYLLTEIKDKSPLIALIDKELSLNVSLLECVFQYSKREIIQYNTSSLITAPLPPKFQIILMTNNLSRLEKMFSNLTKKDVKAYSFSGLLNKFMERKLRHQFPNVALFLINCDQVLCQETLSGVMFEVRRWLSAKQTRSILHGIECPTSKSGYSVSFEQNPSGNEKHLAQHIPVVISKYQMFNKHATYIIIGGLTGLGWEILKAIAARGGGVLITISRRLPNDQQLQNIDEIRRKYGCVIECIQADVSIFSSIFNAFNQIKVTFPEQVIKGIFHGAAVVDDALLTDMTEEKFDKVLRPKVIGTWNLHLLANDLTLDFFVLHSSISSAFGNAGQTNYGAGNAFKDAIAFHRRGLGLAGQSINWGALKLGLVQERTEEYLKSQGFLAMKENEIVHCFIHSLFINSAQVVCGVIDWKTVMNVSPDMFHLTSRLQTILEDLNLIDTTVVKQSKISYIKLSETEELQTLSTRKKRTKVLETVSQIAADACAVDLSIIQSKTTLSSLGIDSMKGMSFINNVYKYISCKISIIAILEEDATIESISDLIFKQIQIDDEVNAIENHERPVDEKKTTQKSSKKDRLEDIQCEVTIDNENNVNNSFSLSVINREGPRRLHWRTREKENVIYFTDIANFQIRDLNGLKELMIETRKEKFVFKSGDTRHMKKLSMQLKDALTTLDSTNL